MNNKTFVGLPGHSVLSFQILTSRLAQEEVRDTWLRVVHDSASVVAKWKLQIQSSFPYLPSPERSNPDFKMNRRLFPSILRALSLYRWSSSSSSSWKENTTSPCSPPPHPASGLTDIYHFTVLSLVTRKLQSLQTLCFSTFFYFFILTDFFFYLTCHSTSSLGFLSIAVSF